MRRPAMLVAATLALAACSGAADPEPAPLAATTTAAPTTTTVDVDADKARARTLVLRPADLPAGWKATPHREDPTDKTYDAQLAACLGRPSPDTYLTASADSPDFARGDAEVSSQAQLVKTVADFNADVDAVQGPKFVPCVKRVLTKSLQPLAGASLRSVAVAPLPVASYGQFSLVDAMLADDDALDRWIRQTVGTARHVSGTCKMGPDSDPMAVVDQYCRVKGVQGLWVVDASVMPRIPRSGGTHATVIMIGERVVDWVAPGTPRPTAV